MKLGRLAFSIVLLSMLAACGSTGASSSPPSASIARATPRSATTTQAPSSGPKPGQTDTGWGRIWDDLPPGFPIYPGGTPDENAAGGPASAVFVLDGLDARGSATFLQTLLQKAGYTMVGSIDALEDGSVVLEMTGSPKGCAVEATATPTGNLTTVRILYGADCPYD